MPTGDTDMIILFSLLYWVFAAMLVAPPTEFISAGLTVQNIFSSFLGSETMNFVYFHIKRTSITVLVHSLFPLCYYILLGLFLPQLQLFTPWRIHIAWQILLGVSISIFLLAVLMVVYWSLNKWNNHPVARRLGHLGDSNNSWRAIASSVNVEFRRMEKFTSSQLTGSRIIVTDSWVIKAMTYTLHVAHQRDIHLTLAASEEHSIGYENMTAVQFIHINVGSVNPRISPFTIRVNALEYRDIKDKLQSPVRNARNIVIRQSLSEQFLQAFAEQIAQNPVYNLTGGMGVDTCIGCLQKESDIKLNKNCDNAETGECVQCYCRPMWCLECMGKWFASRQDQQRPETWLGSKSPCPTCRATFCLLDVSKIQT